MSSTKNYLAFDLSTQSLKAIITNDNLEILTEESVNFDTELREFQTENGVHRNPDGRVITSPTLMWIKALDIIMMKMAHRKVNFRDICMVSGTAQQHGSVYWAHSAEMTLTSLDMTSPLADQLQNCFAVNDSPVWMDSSTEKQCKELEIAVGGGVELANITGSKAYERFTGNQIAKFYQENKKLYGFCERISLVSSFLASIFLGRYASIDLSDGSGMNLLNIHTKQWEQKLLDACAPDLAYRLGPPVPSSDILGTISKYMADRYMFSPECSVVAFTGDNPASLAGMRLAQGDIALSLGTSDTIIFSTDVANPSTEGHIFVNPLDQCKYMALLCFKNGSLSRELVCNKSCNASWDIFNETLKRTPAGNHGNLGIYFDEMEILPHAKGVYRWNEASEFVSEFDPDVEVRAIIEGQFLAKRYHVENFGFKRTKESRILATGGASKNISILQVVSDIFNCSVYALPETSNSACLGCVYRCKQATLGDGIDNYCRIIKEISSHTLVCSPNPDNVEVYENLLDSYGHFEAAVVELCTEKSDNQVSTQTVESSDAVVGSQMSNATPDPTSLSASVHDTVAKTEDVCKDDSTVPSKMKVEVVHNGTIPVSEMSLKLEF